ncbi:hypothetical protein COEREDRAFT_85954 [Coemansia reversa NRRL 1564]|uniref:Uncharacterized protein n=1 Tax=Coemansia reversa (strain ATCC 12441 / NRRL 1564) TaxID=763665 RepID=A0A2G5BF85_COERN|nr:hypothetical protein COEREDRAFT_85954 [Coemansia reversa NRRL 1564]|eukprot:PIA17686.1 hypothetical protein COEREDRAFT_85954 [Coemansia reversa NRRL 1564]
MTVRMPKLQTIVEGLLQLNLLFGKEKFDYKPAYLTPYDLKALEYIRGRLKSRDENICLDPEKGVNGISIEEREIIIYTKKKDENTAEPNDRMLRIILGDLRVDARNFNNCRIYGPNQP